MDMQPEIEILNRAGYRAIRENGNLLVQDPVWHMSGDKRWMDYEWVTIKPCDVSKFLHVRS